ncbi:MAG: aldehyde dehydrogenase family protein [Rubrobacteraceae bacterium]
MTTDTASPKMTIDGRSVGAEAGIEVANPALGEVAWTVPDCSAEQLDAAVAGAAGAFPEWAARPMGDRQKALLEVVSRVEENIPKLAELLTREQGQPLSNATSEINAALAYCRAYAEMSLPPEVVADNEDEYVEIRRVPLGVVAAITAWNYPLLLALWKIAPALVAGNTVVVKPSPFTPVATLRLGEILADVLPPGVLQIVSGGDGVGRRLTTHPDVAKVSFTGSVATGREIMASAAPTMKRLTLELGGNDPGIVLPDFDLDAMSDPLYWTAFSNCGQVCAGLKRLYAPEEMADELCARLAEVAETVRVGNGLEDGSTTGPVQNSTQLARIRELLDDALANGAEVAYQSEIPDGPGWFFPITIVRGVAEGVRLVDEEPFGPILPVMTYTDLDEAVQRANDSEYGLGASVWSPDIERASSVAERLRAGTVWVNRHPHLSPHVPFGGIRQSGVGVESSAHGLREYTDITVLDVKRK